jgi:hypothetical protein
MPGRVRVAIAHVCVIETAPPLAVEGAVTDTFAKFSREKRVCAAEEPAEGLLFTIQRPRLGGSTTSSRSSSGFPFLELDCASRAAIPSW